MKALIFLIVAELTFSCAAKVTPLKDYRNSQMISIVFYNALVVLVISAGYQGFLDLHTFLSSSLGDRIIQVNGTNITYDA